MNRARGAARLATAAGVLVCLAPAMARAGDGFGFGSYGRVGVGGDLRGGGARRAAVVPYSTRVAEATYVEAELSHGSALASGGRYDVVFTLAFADDLFHFTGRFDQTLAIRNLYLEARDVLAPDLVLWAGSRMYRGDDVYLLDWWPLDNLNTVGGGVGYRAAGTDFAVHAGLSQLDDPFERQWVDVPDRVQGATSILRNDRQRVVTSFKLARELRAAGGSPGDLGLKVKLYGEWHHLPSGARERARGTVEDLPPDEGWLAGAQLGAWNVTRNGFVNLFVRAAGGLAVYDIHQVPLAFGTDRRTAGARELRAALSANLESTWVGAQVASHLRWFRDGDGNRHDVDDGIEGLAAVRLYGFATEHFHPGVEVSWEGRRPEGLSPTAGRHFVPQVVKLSLLPTVSLAGSAAGTYGRPHLRLVYSAAWLNAGARDLYPAQDPRHGRAWQHFLGVMAEWWFASRSYGGGS